MGAHPAPVLETERLILRGFVAEDFSAFKAIHEKPAVHQYLGGSFEGHESLWRRTVSAVGQWIVMGYGGWIVTVKDDGRIIGNVGLFDAQRQLEAGFDGEPEMGWVLDTDEHGKGYGIEACRAVIDWADAKLKRDLWAIISPENEASFRLADKLGFERVAVNRYHDDDIVVLKRSFDR